MNRLILLLLFSYIFLGCSYNANTHKASITSFVDPVYELAETVAKDIKECGVANSNGCEITTSNDGYDQSKIKAMSNEELEEHVQKLKRNLQ